MTNIDFDEDLSNFMNILKENKPILGHLHNIENSLSSDKGIQFYTTQKNPINFLEVCFEMSQFKEFEYEMYNKEVFIDLFCNILFADTECFYDMVYRRKSDNIFLNSMIKLLYVSFCKTKGNHIWIKTDIIIFLNKLSDVDFKDTSWFKCLLYNFIFDLNYSQDINLLNHCLEILDIKLGNPRNSFGLVIDQLQDCFGFLKDQKRIEVIDEILIAISFRAKMKHYNSSKKFFSNALIRDDTGYNQMICNLEKLNKLIKEKQSSWEMDHQLEICETIIHPEMFELFYTSVDLENYIVWLFKMYIALLKEETTLMCQHSYMKESFKIELNKLVKKDVKKKAIKFLGNHPIDKKYLSIISGIMKSSNKETKNIAAFCREIVFQMDKRKMISSSEFKQLNIQNRDSMNSSYLMDDLDKSQLYRDNFEYNSLESNLNSIYKSKLSLESSNKSKMLMRKPKESVYENNNELNQFPKKIINPQNLKTEDYLPYLIKTMKEVSSMLSPEPLTTNGSEFQQLKMYSEEVVRLVWMLNDQNNMQENQIEKLKKSNKLKKKEIKELKKNNDNGIDKKKSKETKLRAKNTEIKQTLGNQIIKLEIELSNVKKQYTPKGILEIITIINNYKNKNSSSFRLSIEDHHSKIEEKSSKFDLSSQNEILDEINNSSEISAQNYTQDTQTKFTNETNIDDESVISGTTVKNSHINSSIGSQNVNKQLIMQKKYIHMLHKINSFYVDVIREIN